MSNTVWFIHKTYTWTCCITLDMGQGSCTIQTDRNSVSVSVTAPKLAILLVSVTAVIAKHGFGLLSVTAETTTRFRCEPKLSLLAIRYSCTAAVLLMSALSRSER